MFSNGRQKGSGSRWEGRRGGTKRSRGRRNHNQDIIHKKILFICLFIYLSIYLIYLHCRCSFFSLLSSLFLLPPLLFPHPNPLLLFFCSVVKRSEQKRLRPVSIKNGMSARHQVAGEQQSKNHTFIQIASTIVGKMILKQTVIELLNKVMKCFVYAL